MNRETIMSDLPDPIRKKVEEFNEARNSGDLERLRKAAQDLRGYVIETAPVGSFTFEQLSPEVKALVSEAEQMNKKPTEKLN